LSGLPEAITTVCPQTVVQTCVVHVIRNAMKFVSYQDRTKGRGGHAGDLHGT
jgi:putative transposase